MVPRVKMAAVASSLEWSILFEHRLLLRLLLRLLRLQLRLLLRFNPVLFCPFPAFLLSGEVLASAGDGTKTLISR